MSRSKEHEILKDEEDWEYNIFPLGPYSVISIFERLREEDKQLIALVEDSDLGVAHDLARENGPAMAFLYKAGLGIQDQETLGGFTLGYLLLYAALRAKYSPDLIPQINQDFVNSYAEMDIGKAGRGFGVQPVGVGEAHPDFSTNLALLVGHVERDATQAIREEVGQRFPQSPQVGEYLVAGFSQAYFLFREGFSHPANLTIPKPKAAN